MNFNELVMVNAFLNDNRTESRRKPRVSRTPADISGDNLRQFRLNEEQVGELVQGFHTWRGRGTTFSSEKRVHVFLSMIASGGYYRQVGHTFGLAPSTVCAYTHEVADSSVLFDYLILIN